MDKAANKKEYLKKYLAGSDKKKKKKKVTTSSSTSRSRIVDDDLDLKNMRALDDNELEIYDLAEDAPQIAGIVDDRPDEVRVMSQYRETKKWKIVTREYEDVKVSSIKGSDSDLSPSRGRVAQRSSEGKTNKNVQKVRENYSDSDISVSRNRDSDSDASPPRKKPSRPTKTIKKIRQDSDCSPPRRKGDKNTSLNDSDESPPRRSKPVDSGLDVSPKRSKKQEHRREKSRWERNDSKDNDSLKRDKHVSSKIERKDSGDRDRSEKMSKTLAGKKAGLQNATEMKKEAAELRRRHAESLSQLGDDVSGRGAATIQRDRKTGKKRDLKEEARLKREKDAKNAELVEKYAVWGKGMKQIDERTVKMKEDLHEMSKPVARYVDDEDLEDMRKNEEREGDPMLEYMRSKTKKEGVGKAKQQYQGSFMPNRYNIRPGYRWDGVDRSSGYEKKWFEEKNARKALEEEAFKWSTEDM